MIIDVKFEEMQDQLVVAHFNILRKNTKIIRMAPMAPFPSDQKLEHVNKTKRVTCQSDQLHGRCLSG